MMKNRILQAADNVLGKRKETKNPFLMGQMRRIRRNKFIKRHDPIGYKTINNQTTDK